MGTIRYLGSKSRLADSIAEILGPPSQHSSARFIDLFCGTGAVSAAASDAGWPVTANDNLLAATVMTAARLMTKAQVRFNALGGYQHAIASLNAVHPIEGFFFREYSPSGVNQAAANRRYFTPENAAKIDGMRAQILAWSEASQLSQTEHWLLLADLIAATNQVANIAGTYGCFMRIFSTTASRHIRLRQRALRDTAPDWRVSTADAMMLKPRPADTAYLDPPYTKRQYAAYYHIPETIAAEDEPDVVGITGLRPWEQKASPFCYKSRAAKALDALLSRHPCHRVIISYSSDGHIPPHQMATIVERHGTTTTYRFENFGRYAPNQESRLNGARRPLTEFVFDMRR